MTIDQTTRSRAEVLDRIRFLLEASGVPWAWQGARDAVPAWLADDGPGDLDIWCAADQDTVEELVRQVDGWPAARVADVRDPRRLRHVSWAVETCTGLAVVDLTLGDLRVGPVLLVPANQVRTHPGAGPASGPRLAGVAGAADLLVRPLLRGRLPRPQRIAEAQSCWGGADEDARALFLARLRRQVGGRLAVEIGTVLAGRRPAAELPGRSRRALARCTLRPSGLGASWAQRRTVLPAGRSAGPLGARARDVVVALVGTDGAGKSTVGTELAARLRSYGFEVRETYFGMARDNLPGAALARRLLRVPGAGAVPLTGSPTGSPTGTFSGTFSGTPIGVEPAPGAGSPDPTLSLPLLRRAAAWYYAVDYLWRYLRRVLPHRLRRRVVVCDRWVCDLRGSPWPGSPAARVVERLLPPPDLLVLPDAPAEVLHRRKPERPLAEQARQQEEFRQLLRSAPARSTAVVVDTSGQTDDPVGPLLAAVVRAAHSARGADPARRPGR